MRQRKVNMNYQKGSATVILLVVLVVVLAIVLVYFAFLKKPGEVAVSPTPTPTKTATPSPDWKTYTNTEYGFQVTLTDAWKGYRVIKKASVGLSDSYNLYFEVPIKDKNYSDKLGYAAPMAISVYPKTVWAQIQQENAPMGTYIAENSNYVFAYSHWQDSPAELRNVDFKITQIISTFKFTK